MSTPLRVSLQAITIIHDRQLARHGGVPGLRDFSLLEAAVERLRNKLVYGAPELEGVAAAYAFGIVKAHAFVDGNK